MKPAMHAAAWNEFMAELSDIQTRVGAALVDPRSDDVAAGLIADADATRRLAIYRNNIASNAAGALRSIYPVIRKIVGTEFFDALARRYCEAHPSVSGDLNDIGGDFSSFVRGFEPARELAYLSDVATLEWCVHRAHYAADHAPLEPQALSALLNGDVAQLLLKLHSAVAIVSSPYPLFQIWRMHQDDYAAEIDVDLASGGEDVVVHRPQFHAAVANLSAAEAAFLTSIVRGELLGEALASCGPFDFAASMKNWVAANLIVEIAPAK